MTPCVGGRPRFNGELKRVACPDCGEYRYWCGRCVSRTTVYWLKVHTRLARLRNWYQQKKEQQQNDGE